MWRPRGSAAALLLALAVGVMLSRRQGPQDAGSGEQGPAAAASSGGSAGLPVRGVELGELQQQQTPQQQQQQQQRNGGDGSASSRRLHSRPAGGGLHIVRFRQYKMAEQHRAELDTAFSIIALAGSWEWVERQNPAAAFPTDFGLLRLAEPSLGTLKARLEQLPFVKDVHPERQLTRALMTAGDPAVQQQEQEQGALAQPSAPCSSSSSSSSSSGSAGSESASAVAETGDAEQQEQLCVTKRPGRLQTRPTFSLEDNQEEEDGLAVSLRVANDTFAGTRSSRRQRSLQQMPGQTLASILQADKVWEQGFRGQGVKMGVFDTGIKGDHPDVKHIEERSNWTHEPTLDDGLGHGSFVAGVIAGTDPSCPGLAPEVLLHTFRVFTNDQVSYTSWFLDAFNYAMATKMNIVNLSIGGPDYLDLPFVEKVAEITSSGIIMVSAIGNDGPLYGTLNNPADQNDVIGIGGIDYSDNIAPFSSRGMSTWEVPLGYGRSKPDIMAYGRDVQGSRIGGGCRSLSGTSVASPVVAGAVCLLSSVVPEEKRWQILNPASMKQALVEGAVRLPGLNLYEQGAGKLSVVNSKAILERYIPRASLVPRALNFTDCPYMWPFCRQPLYAGAMPVMFNATILNGMSLTGKLEAAPVWTPADEGGKLLDVQFEYSQQLWPWSGYLAIYLRVKPEGAGFTGRGSGEFNFTVVSPPARGEAQPRRSIVTVPLTADIIPTPPRSKRVLWDQFHSIRYPPAYFPRDDLQVRHDILDWHGDHPHTNFHDMYDALRDEGYFLEVLASPATCFNASAYGSLLIVDSEDEFYPEEVAKLAADVEQLGMGLLIFADWYHVESIQKLRFYDDNTRSWWEAATGGANVPALNDLLVPFGAAFEASALDADVVIEGLPGQGPFQVSSGATIKAVPAGTWLHRTPSTNQKEGQPPKPGAPVLALFQHGAGRVGLYGDSNCLDSSHSRSQCFALLARMLQWAAGEDVPALTPESALQAAPYGNFEGMAARRPDFNFSEISPVLQTPIRCYPNSPLEFHGAAFQQWKIPVSRPARQAVAVQPDQPGAQQDPQALGAGAASSAADAAAATAAQQQAEVATGVTANATSAGAEQPAAGSASQQQPAAGSADQQALQQPQQPAGTATEGAQQQAASAAGTQQQPQAGTDQAAVQQQHAAASTAAEQTQQQQQQEVAVSEAEKAAAAQQAEAAKQAAAQQQADAAKQAAEAAKAAEEAQKAAAQQQAEQEEIKKQEEALKKKAEEGARKQKEAEAARAAAAAAAKAQLKKQQHQQKQQAGGTVGTATVAGAGNGSSSSSNSVDMRDHPDINTLAQAGEGGPHHVEDEPRPKQPAEEGEGPKGEGAAARASSLMHKKAAAAAAAAAGHRSGSPYQQSLVLEGGLLCVIAAAVLWSRSRRRRCLPLRFSTRRWLPLLPLWGNSGGGARNRHE